MSLDDLRQRLDAVLPSLAGLQATIKFDLGGDGAWLVDARSAPPTLQAGDHDADCTIRASAEDLLKLLDGRLDPMLAYTLGKLKVAGSMGVAMKLAQALG